MLKAILFDLGDTLFDFASMDKRAVFEEAGRKSYQFLLDRGHRLPAFKRYFRWQYRAVQLSYLWSRIRCREFNSFTLLGSLCRHMKLDLDDATLRQLAWEWYAPLTRYTSVAPDVIPTLTKFRDRGLKLAIVSNTFIPGFVLDRHMDMHGLLEFFPVRIYSSEVRYRKPDRRIFQIALDAVGETPETAVFIGDLVKTDIAGAHGIGMTAVLRQPSAPSRTHRVADHVVRKITELYQILPLLGAAAPQPMPEVEELVCEA